VSNNEIIYYCKGQTICAPTKLRLSFRFLWRSLTIGLSLFELSFRLSKQHMLYTAQHRCRLMLNARFTKNVNKHVCYLSSFITLINLVTWNVEKALSNSWSERSTTKSQTCVYFVVTVWERICWLLHKRTGISNFHELQNIHYKPIEKCQRYYQLLLTFVFCTSINAFINVYYYYWRRLIHLCCILHAFAWSRHTWQTDCWITGRKRKNTTIWVESRKIKYGNAGNKQTHCDVRRTFAIWSPCITKSA